MAILSRLKKRRTKRHSPFGYFSVLRPIVVCPAACREGGPRARFATSSRGISAPGRTSYARQRWAIGADPEEAATGRGRNRTARDAPIRRYGLRRLKGATATSAALGAVFYFARRRWDSVSLGNRRRVWGCATLRHEPGGPGTSGDPLRESR